MTIPAVLLTAAQPIIRIRGSIPWLPERYARRTERLRIRFRTSAGERSLYRKKKRLPPSQWAPKYRKITYGPLKGAYYDPDFMPHMNGIMDAAAEACVREVVNCKAPQTGGSANWETFLANRADVAPMDALIVYPDRDTASKRCKDYLQPMFTSSPRLRRLLTGYKDDEAALRVKLLTMLIYMGWSGSVTSIGNVSVGLLIVDELDKCQEYPSKKEASFETLVAERVTAYAKFGSTIIWNSTPTAYPSRIVAKLQQMQTIFDFYATCPDCGHLQLMEFARIDFAGVRDPEQMETGRQARYACARCGSLWDDRSRDLAVRGGSWHARDEAARAELIKAGQWQCQPVGLGLMAHLRKHRTERIGFHSPAWISPLNSLSKCAAAFLAGLRDEMEMIYFDTQIAAQEHTRHKRQRKEDTLLALRDDRPEGLVPSGGVVCALVAGSDTQDNGHFYWIDAVGWGLEQERWRIRAGFVETRAALVRSVFESEYRDIDGNLYPVQLMVKDAMGHRTAEVYELCLQHPGRVVPYKGATGRRPNPHTVTRIDRYPGTTKPIPGGVSLYTCDSHHYKDRLAAKLAIKGDDGGAWHFDQGFNEDQARQLCVEYSDGRGLWQCPHGAANHYWDCAMMSIIASDLLQLKFLARPEPAAAQAQTKRSTAPNPYTGGREIFGR